LFHTSANWWSERDQVHLGELLRVPFPLPDADTVSSDAKQIVKQVVKIVEKLRDKLNDKLNNISRHRISSTAPLPTDKKWLEERMRQVDAAQSEIEPLIYKYFGLTEQEMMLVEDTIQIFEPSSTPTTWLSPNLVTLENVERTKVKDYVGYGLKTYADTIASTLNSWAKAEKSSHRVTADGSTDNDTGLGMVTIRLSNHKTNYYQKIPSRRLATVLKQFYRDSAKKQGSLVYERDVFFSHRNLIYYIVRPNILMNWTRTAALNDAARIYGEIALAVRGVNEK
jgi:hypothetical protein